MKTIFLVVVVLLGLGILAGGFAAFGPPGLYAKSESPEFCASCHNMEPQYEAWFHAGAHRTIKCVDCHLPNDTLAAHLAWKSLTGMRDLLEWHLGLASGEPKASLRTQGWIQANCQRCHAELMGRVNEDRWCWTCHRQFQHTLTGTVVAVTP
jgi:cytochrome c nitrite reductase small subunit